MKLNRIIVSVLFFVALTASSLFAKKTKTDDSKLKVVTTIFPEYDWAKEIIGEKADNVELTLLMNNGVDLHSYSPSVKDIAKISESDIFVYVGGESDEWVDGVLKNAKNKNMKIINLLDVLGEKVKSEEIVEGMEHEHDEHNPNEHHHDDDDEDEKDEHVWLSLRNASELCAAIADALCEKDSANASVYKKNLASYTAKLSRLDGEYSDVVKSSRVKTLLFGDRFPFRYLVDDYNLKYFAAFTGCSAESEASFNTIVFLAGKLDELGLKSVCQIENGNGKIAKTVIANSKTKNATILTFDSLQSTTAKQIKKGATYLGTMEKNLSVLKEALK